MLFIHVLPEVSVRASAAASKIEHEGFCPNKLNSNLWVDAQSTCEKECSVDEVLFRPFIIATQFLFWILHLSS